MYEYLKTRLCKEPENPSKTERFIAGAGAGAIAQSSIYPLEITKTRLALAKTGELSGIASTMRMIVTKEGISGLYRGCYASILGIMPYAGTDLMVYNTLRHWYIKHQEDEPSTMVILTSGAFASVCGQLVSYPLQLIRTRLQSYGRNPGDWGDKPTIRGITRHIIKKKGVLGLYTGISCNLMKSIPAISITYVGYEKTRFWLRKAVYGE